MRVTEFKPMQKNTLQGFFSLELTSGIVIKDMTLHRKGDKQWVSFPARPYQDKEGNQKWAKIIEIPDQERWWHFNSKALEAVAKYQPPETEKVPQDDFPF
jgi:hypothetical protein